MSEWVIDASLALQWFLEDEADRNYSLAILRGLADNEAVVPILWYYEIGNGLIMAHRRKRITFQQLTEFLKYRIIGGRRAVDILQKLPNPVRYARSMFCLFRHDRPSIQLPMPTVEFRVCELVSLTEWILTQMSQDLVQVRKPSFSAEARLRADNGAPNASSSATLHQRRLD